jgi:putative FmdB family regulatory protein
MAHHWQSPGASASPATDFPHHQGAIAVPTYQYACTNPEGKHEFELVQSFTDAPVSECPECGAPVRKVYGSVGVVFKGSGFYRTDSRAVSKKGSSAATSGAADSSGAAKPDAKPDTKADSTSGARSDSTAAPASEKKSEKKSDKKGDSKVA